MITEEQSGANASPQIYLGGARCDLLDQNELFGLIREAIEENHKTLLVSSFNLNHLHYYAKGRESEGFFEDSEARGISWKIVVDGQPIKKRVSGMGKREWDKLSGSDMIEQVLQMSFERGWRVANVGGSPETRDKLYSLCEKRWPGLVVRGWTPLREELDENNEQLAREIREFGADLVVVSLPKPISERWGDAWIKESGAKVGLCFGGAIEFMLGAQQRAPKKISDHGLEWAWRLAHNPRRLFRRYVIEGPKEWLELQQISVEPEVTTPDSWRKKVARRLFGADVLVAGAASFGASMVRATVGGEWLRAYAPSWAAVLVAIPILVVSIGLAGGRKTRGVRLDGEIGWRLIKGSALGVAGVGLVSFAFHLNISRGYVGLMGILGIVGGLAVRGLYASVLTKRRKLGKDMVRCGVVGEGEGLSSLISWLKTHPGLGYKIAWQEAFLPSTLPSLVGVLIIDTMDYGAIARADEIMNGGGEVMVVPALTTIDAKRLEADTFSNQSVLHLLSAEMTPMQRALKRALDVTITLIVLIPGLPVMGVIALAVRLGDKGPVLFRQTRVGADSQEFTVYKFRTMVVNAESLLESLLVHNEVGGHMFKMRDDPRITRVGKILRKTSLDELPQLFNVLRGEMSLVGPRPALPQEVNLMKEEGQRRHRVRPGVTGLWQVSGRSNLSAEQALELDLHYVANWSLAGDISILLRTVKTVVLRDGAV